MDQLPDYKALKKLADACRKSGIKTFKGFGFEFTLTDEAPSKQTRHKKDEQKQPDSVPVTEHFPTDALDGDALLFWSSSNPVDDALNGDQ